MKTTLMLADDHEIFRQGLFMLLSSQSDLHVIGQAANGLEAVALAERLRPNILIVDMLMPGLSGMDVTHRVHQLLPDTKIIILSMYDEESYVRTALQNGASAYVLKDSSTADLVQAVHAVIVGQRFLSPRIADRAIQAYINQTDSQDENEYDLLTNREREVLHLSAEGLSAVEIAKQLTISVRTAETHRAHLMHKLGIHSQEELVAFARKQKIIP